jgi:hypothetical protein
VIEHEDVGAGKCDSSAAVDMSGHRMASLTGQVRNFGDVLVLD